MASNLQLEETQLHTKDCIFPTWLCTEPYE